MAVSTTASIDGTGCGAEDIGVPRKCRPNGRTGGPRLFLLSGTRRRRLAFRRHPYGAGGAGTDDSSARACAEPAADARRAAMLANRVQHFTESVIRETTRIAQRHGAINLGQGMPDFDPPEEVKDAACQAIRDGFNQYAVTWGIAPLRQAIAAKMRAFNGLDWADADAHVTVCCGATECMMATMLALVDP